MLIDGLDELIHANLDNYCMYLNQSSASSTVILLLPLLSTSFTTDWLLGLSQTCQSHLTSLAKFLIISMLSFVAAHCIQIHATPKNSEVHWKCVYI